MTDCNCGCSTFGPGPHDADLRHPNPRACEHAEDGLDEEALAAAIDLHDHIGATSERAISCGRGHVGGCADRIAAAYARIRSGADLDSIVDPSL